MDWWKCFGLYTYKSASIHLSETHFELRKNAYRITFQSKYHLQKRATPGRLHFSPSGLEMQMGRLYADFIRICGAITPPSLQ